MQNKNEQANKTNFFQVEDSWLFLKCCPKLASIEKLGAFARGFQIYLKELCDLPRHNPET